MGPGPRWALLMGPGPCWALLAPLLAPLLRCAAGRLEFEEGNCMKERPIKMESDPHSSVFQPEVANGSGCQIQILYRSTRTLELVEWLEKVGYSCSKEIPKRFIPRQYLQQTMQKEYSLPYTPQFAQCKDPSTEFYDEELNKCCSQCPPGQYKTESCSHSVDTKCRPCRPNTYTAIWNLSPLCFACSPPCRKGLVQNQTCTKSQDRTCSCPPNEYCILKIYDSCKICEVHKKCGKGYRVSRKGTDSTDTECKPCPPGTFSHEESYDTSCVPHTVCKSVAVPGNNINDTVCSDSGTTVATVLPHTILNLLLTQSSSSSKPEIITRPVILNSVPDVSHIIGSVAGPLLLILIIAVLGVCLVSKKKALVYSPATTGADLPISPAEKLCDKKVRNTESQNSSSSEQEEQRLLETSGSSSSSLNNPAGSAGVGVISNNNEKPETEGFQQRPSAAEGCQLHSGDRHNSASSELSGNGGTHVNVTCIVKVCSPDCSSQFPEQNSSTSMDRGNAPYYSPTGEEIPLSKEENPLKKQTAIQISVENEDNLLQDLLPEEKKFPLGIQDVGMKNS